MTREEILAALAMADGASNGPWACRAGSFKEGYANTLWSTAKSDDPHTEPLIVSHLHYAPQDAADFAFIAASRALVPALATALLEAMDRAERAETENESLRKVIVESANALGNGAFVHLKCSTEFMSFVPDEIRRYVTQLVGERDAATLAADQQRLRAKSSEFLAEKLEVEMGRMRERSTAMLVFETVDHFEGLGSQSYGWKCLECGGAAATRDAVEHTDGCPLYVEKDPNV